MRQGKRTCFSLEPVLGHLTVARRASRAIGLVIEKKCVMGDSTEVRTTEIDSAVQGAAAEMGQSLIAERVRAGLRSARAKGKGQVSWATSKAESSGLAGIRISLRPFVIILHLATQEALGSVASTPQEGAGCRPCPRSNLPCIQSKKQ